MESQPSAPFPDKTTQVMTADALHDPDKTQMVLPPARSRPQGEQPGDSIERYKLVTPLGEGGFGTVWQAEQVEGVNRVVALKIIKLGMDTSEVIARFEQERQALALMDHPNIARVLDAGATASGRPFFVMELVNGVPITDFCNQHKLGLRQRVDLFSRVCLAINHAHQKGIVHRDIKPSNVLVSSEEAGPLVKVIDFGIAKAIQGKLTDKTLLTGQGQIIGTPAYMSPEQTALNEIDVDTRSDIYSLGVLLYELLVGRPPFDPKALRAAGYLEMCRIILEQEPQKPSTQLGLLDAKGQLSIRDTWQIDSDRLARELRGDLDWIVMRALEKDRERRYATANDFALDLRRFLVNEPVLASPPGTAYRLRKFARRNKVVLFTGASFVLVLVASTLVSLWQMNVAIAAKKEALEREALEREAREEAEAVSSFVTSAFQRTDPSRGSRTITVAETLDRAVRELDAAANLPVRRRIALTYTLGSAYQSLGLGKESVPLLERVHEHYLQTNGADNIQTTQAKFALAASYEAIGRTHDALRLREEVLSQRRKIFGGAHNLDILSAMTALSASYHALNRHSEGVKLNEEALTASRACNGPEHSQTIQIMANLAASYASARRFDEAVKMMETELEVVRRLRGPKHPSTLTSLGNLAACLAEMGRAEDAVKRFQEVVTLNREILGPEHPTTLSSAGNLALSLGQAGRAEESERVLMEVLAILRRTQGAHHPETCRLTIELGRIYKDTERYEQACKLLEDLLPITRKATGEQHPLTVSVMEILGFSLARVGKLQEAAKMQGEALELMRTIYGPEDSTTLAQSGNLAMTLNASGRLAEAIPLMEKTWETARRVLPRSDPDRQIYVLNLAILYDAAGRKEDADKLRAGLRTSGPVDSGKSR